MTWSSNPKPNAAGKFPPAARLNDLQDEAEYICDSCGESIIIPIDFSSGPRQEYIEDCPVCCCANVIYLEIDEIGCATVWAQLE